MGVSILPLSPRRKDVINVEQARIAEEAGAVAVMALERIPADIRVDGGVARMSDPQMIREIKAAVSIPVMAKVCTVNELLPFLLLLLSFLSRVCSNDRCWLEGKTYRCKHSLLSWRRPYSIYIYI